MFMLAAGVHTFWIWLGLPCCCALLGCCFLPLPDAFILCLPPAVLFDHALQLDELLHLPFLLL